MTASTATTVTGTTTNRNGYVLNTLDMRRPAVHARQDLSWELRQQGFSNDQIMAMVGFNDTSSVSTAIKRGKERAIMNMGRISYRRFGVEVEFTGTTRREVADKLLELDPGFPVEVQGYNHRVTSVWKLITDASVNSGPEGAGLEAVSPILSGPEGYAQLATLMKAIKLAGGTVDKSCGIHVHHDANDMSPVAVANMVTFYAKNQRIMDQMVSRSRRSSEYNRYCQPLSTTEANEVEAAVKNATPDSLRHGHALSMFNRFRTINVTSFPKYGTLEIRQHQGTLNAKKVGAWVKVGQAMMVAAMAQGEAATPVFTELPELLAYLTEKGGLDREVADYMVERAEDLS
jgi:hypothetical protein